MKNTVCVEPLCTSVLVGLTGSGPSPPLCYRYVVAIPEGGGGSNLSERGPGETYRGGGGPQPREGLLPDERGAQRTLVRALWSCCIVLYAYRGLCSVSCQASRREGRARRCSGSTEGRDFSPVALCSEFFEHRHVGTCSRLSPYVWGQETMLFACRGLSTPVARVSRVLRVLRVVLRSCSVSRSARASHRSARPRSCYLVMVRTLCATCGVDVCPSPTSSRPSLLVCLPPLLYLSLALSLGQCSCEKAPRVARVTLVLPG